MAVRVDRWLFSVRVYKTRTVAAEACTTGRVKVNGTIAKPATKITVGDRVQATRRDRVLVYEVVSLIEKRVSAARAAECVIDHSPPPSERSADFVETPVFARRDRGAGRPTKRDRRMIDKLRGERR
jgi:ribosome-associated heat shock protein Hsp15